MTLTKLVNGERINLTEKEIKDRELDEAKFEEDVAFAKKNEWILQRIKAYPPFGDQLDAVFKGGEDFEEMKQKLIAIKEKYPKPEDAGETTKEILEKILPLSEAITS